MCFVSRRPPALSSVLWESLGAVHRCGLERFGNASEVIRIGLVGLSVFAALAAVGAAVWISSWWWIAGVPFALLGLLGIWDLAQPRHSVLRNYPVIGHARFLMESIRPEFQQYFVERNFDGRPFDRDVRSIVYERAKGTDAEEPYGTERDVYGPGHP